MKKLVASILFVMILACSVPCWAHFQIVIPEKSLVTKECPKDVKIDLRFIHPFEGTSMDMVKPARFGVVHRGEDMDLLDSLHEISIGEKCRGWSTTFSFKKPGDYVFYVEPKPYWEPAEDKYIVHYTKVVVDAFGMEDGWDAETGLRAEIVPLVRPYGLWAGNVFRGKLVVDGEPVAGADVEVEYLNSRGLKVTDDAFVTQIVKTDDNGVFAYAAPWAGWWGFAALSDAPETAKSPDGRDVSVELGAVMWVPFSELP